MIICCIILDCLILVALVGKMKLKVQAQHLRPGDIVGSGEKIVRVYNSAGQSSCKINVRLKKRDKERVSEWGKYTMINVERAE